MNRIETRKVGVPAIHRDDGILLHRNNVEEVDVVHCGRGYADKRRDGALQVQERGILMAAFVFRKVAHGNIERHRSMVVESRAKRECPSSISSSSPWYNLRAA